MHYTFLFTGCGNLSHWWNARTLSLSRNTTSTENHHIRSDYKNWVYCWWCLCLFKFCKHFYRYISMKENAHNWTELERSIHLTWTILLQRYNQQPLDRFPLHFDCSHALQQVSALCPQQSVALFIQKPHCIGENRTRSLRCLCLFTNKKHPKDTTVFFIHRGLVKLNFKRLVDNYVFRPCPTIYL